MTHWRRTLLVVALCAMTAGQTLANAQQWVTHGPDAGTNCVVVDPKHPHIVYAACTGPGGDRGLFKSTDGGVTWAEINAGVTLKMFNCLAIDPTNSQVLYAGDEGSGFMKTIDGGAHWALVNSTPVHHGCAIAIDYKHPNIVYMGTDSGIWKSTDGGVRVEQLNAGLPDRGGWSVANLAMDPRNPNILYATAYDELMARGGVWKTVDGGAHWSAAHNGIIGGPIENHPPAIVNLDTARSDFALAIDPRHPETVYVGSLGGGIFKSTDGGANWKAINEGLPVGPYGRRTVYSIVINPKHTNIVYAGTFGSGIYRSTDGGAHWQSFHEGMGLGSGDYRSLIYNMAIDPEHPDTVYAAEYGLGKIYKLVGRR